MENTHNASRVNPDKKEDTINDKNDKSNCRMPPKKRPHVEKSSTASSLITKEFIDEFWRVNEVLHDRARLNSWEDEALEYREFSKEKIIDSNEIKIKKSSGASSQIMEDIEDNLLKKEERANKISAQYAGSEDNNGEKSALVVEDSPSSIDEKSNALKQELDELAQDTDYYPEPNHKEIYSLADFINDNRDMINRSDIFTEDLRKRLYEDHEKRVNAVEVEKAKKKKK